MVNKQVAERSDSPLQNNPRSCMEVSPLRGVGPIFSLEGGLDLVTHS